MSYGHAERTLAAIRLLEQETRELLSRQQQLDPEHEHWLREAADSAFRRLNSGGAARLTRIDSASGTTARSGLDLSDYPEQSVVSRPEPAANRGGRLTWVITALLAGREGGSKVPGEQSRWPLSRDLASLALMIKANQTRRLKCPG